MADGGVEGRGGEYGSSKFYADSRKFFSCIVKSNYGKYNL